MNKLNDIISIDLHIYSVFSTYKEKVGIERINGKKNGKWVIKGNV